MPCISGKEKLYRSAVPNLQACSEWLLLPSPCSLALWNCCGNGRTMMAVTKVSFCTGTNVIHDSHHNTPNDDICDITHRHHTSLIQGHAHLFDVFDITQWICTFLIPLTCNLRHCSAEREKFVKNQNKSSVNNLMTAHTHTTSHTKQHPAHLKLCLCVNSSAWSSSLCIGTIHSKPSAVGSFT